MYTYRVLPFGPVDSPFIFITMMLDLNGKWQALAIERGIKIGKDNNTKLIVDDLFNFCLTEEIAFVYMECIFEIAARRRLSFSLPKSSFFPTRITFVGVDIGQYHNYPNKNKHELLRTWPFPAYVRAVTAFLAFGIFP